MIAGPGVRLTSSQRIGKSQPVRSSPVVATATSNARFANRP